MAKNWFTRLLFDWVFILLCKLMQGLLNLVSFIESFFDIFAGTAKVTYQGNSEFLINIFFNHNAVSNAFWAMALIAIVLSFGFCIVSVARKVTDVAGTARHSIGQICSNFIRCLLIILMLNFASVAIINITNVLLDRINFAMENAAVLNRGNEDRVFTEQEYATMTKILATIANYSVNPSANSRYNINSCFNAIRNDLLSLHVNGFFDYDYVMDQNGHHTWQSALGLLAASADLTTELNLDTYYSDVAQAINTVSQEISTYKEFAPVKSAKASTDLSMSTDVLIFLIAGMEAAQNKMYNNGNFDDSLRRGYITGEKDYMNLPQVRKDFEIWDMDYLVAYIACIVFILIMCICIFQFIVRLFNLLLLYLVAPLFVSSMPLDEGGKFQSWSQAFVIQLFSGFGSIIAMRLYLIIIPIVISSDLIFFTGSGFGNAVLNRMAQLLMVLGGAWAVLQASGLITGILAGNPGMAAIQQEGRIGAMVTRGAMSAVRDTGKIIKGMPKGIQNVATAPARLANSVHEYGKGFAAPYQEAKQRYSRQHGQGGVSDAASEERSPSAAPARGRGSATSDTAVKADAPATGTGGGVNTVPPPLPPRPNRMPNTSDASSSSSAAAAARTAGPISHTADGRIKPKAYTPPAGGVPAGVASAPGGASAAARTGTPISHTSDGKIQPKGYTPPGGTPAPRPAQPTPPRVERTADGKIQPKGYTPPGGKKE